MATKNGKELIDVAAHYGGDNLSYTLYDGGEGGGLYKLVL